MTTMYIVFRSIGTNDNSFQGANTVFYQEYCCALYFESKNSSEAKTRYLIKYGIFSSNSQINNLNTGSS